MSRFRLVPAVHLFLMRDAHVLLARRCNTGFEDGNYSVIAGHLDGGETAIDAMVREAREEAGIVVHPADLRFVHVMHRRSESERIDLFFAASAWEGSPGIAEPDRCDDMRWFPVTGLPGNMVPYVRAALERVRSGASYSEFGWGAG